MKFCTNCGELRGATPFCQSCGKETPPDTVAARSTASPDASDPDTVQIPPQPQTSSVPSGSPAVGRAPAVGPAVQPERGPGRSTLVALASLVILVAAVGASLWWFTREDPSATPSAAPTTSLVPSSGQSSPADATSTQADPSSAEPTPTPTPTPAELTSEVALGLTPGQARSVLTRWQSRDASRVADLAGSWVPQVSSKCTGIAVDLGPGFRPDGEVDEPSVTVQQILALQTALGDRYDAVLTTAGDLGIDQEPGTVCASQVIWVALVPETFSSPEGAHGWCHAAGYPDDECAARLVAPPGQSGTRLDLGG